MSAERTVQHIGLVTESSVKNIVRRHPQTLGLTLFIHYSIKKKKKLDLSTFFDLLIYLFFSYF